MSVRPASPTLSRQPLANRRSVPLPYLHAQPTRVSYESSDRHTRRSPTRGRRHRRRSWVPCSSVMPPRTTTCSTWPPQPGASWAPGHPARPKGKVMTTTAQPGTASDYQDLIDRLDLPTKVRLLTGATMFTLFPEESIGLGELRLSDGPTGVRGLKFSGGRIVALFPNATLLASAWSEDTAEEVGRLLAEEALAQQIHVVLGPTINLHRSLLGGRLFEAYSEDPLLTGRLAAAYVRGLQDS